MRFTNLVILALVITLSGQFNTLSAKNLVNQHYKKYQEHFQNKEFNEALIEVELALAASQSKYGETHQTTLALGLNHAQLYIALANEIDKFEPKKPLAALTNYIEFLESTKGEQTIDLIDPLMSLGSLYAKHMMKPQKGKTQFNRAIEIANNHKEEQPLLAADLAVEASDVLVSAGKGRFVAKDYLIDAYSTYQEHLPEGNERRASTAFFLAKSMHSTKQFRKSNRYFNDVLNGHDIAAVNAHPRVLQSYAFMLKNFEELGESDKATAYCKKIGQAEPWDENQEQTPIFMPYPKMTSTAFRSSKDAHARFRITIDTEGFVDSFEAVESSGNKPFIKAVEKVIPKWRFAPKFENGKPVVATTHYTFELRFE